MQAPVPGRGFLPAAEMAKRQALARMIHDDSSRNRAVAKGDRRAEPRGGALPRLGVPTGVCPPSWGCSQGLAPLGGVGEAGFKAESTTGQRPT